MISALLLWQLLSSQPGKGSPRSCLIRFCTEAAAGSIGRGLVWRAGDACRGYRRPRVEAMAKGCRIETWQVLGYAGMVRSYRQCLG